MLGLDFPGWWALQSWGEGGSLAVAQEGREQQQLLGRVQRVGASRGEQGRFISRDTWAMPAPECCNYEGGLVLGRLETQLEVQLLQGLSVDLSKRVPLSKGLVRVLPFHG